MVDRTEKIIVAVIAFIMAGMGIALLLSGCGEIRDCRNKIPCIIEDCCSTGECDSDCLKEHGVERTP